MLGWLGFLAGSVFGAYDIASVEVTRPHPSLERVVYEVDAGDSPLDRFSIIHVSKRGAGRGCGEPVILFSPFTFPGEFYEISESGRFAKSAAGELAMAGHDVWLVDQRRTELPPGACESGAADCSVMADWGFDTLSNDGLFALSLVRSQHPGARPVIGGFSAGANTAMALVNRAPHAFSGVFLYEGTFYTEDAEIAAHNDAICSNLEGALAAGSTYDPSIAVLGLALRGAAADPQGAFPLPIFPRARPTSSPCCSPSAPRLPRAPSFVRVVADFETQSLVYSDESRLELVGPLFDNYGAIAGIRDLACGLSGRDTSHYSNLSAFRGDVLIYVEGTGFGPAMFDTAGLFDRAASVTIDHNPELGEADVYFNVHWKQTFLGPFTRWLRAKI
jgi:pimeloyl-ACP methyl ester carboxylesterase